MKDKNKIKLYIIIITIGLIQFFSIESLLGISKYAKYYKSIIFISLLIWIYRLPRKRAKVKLYFQSDFFVWAIVLGVLYLISVFLGGVLNDFGKNPYDHDFKGIVINFMMFILPRIISLFARQYIISSSRPNKKMMTAIILTIFIALTQFSLTQYVSNGFEKETLMFLAGQVLPVIAAEALLTYLVYMSGPIPAVVYLLITTLPFYVLEVVPDLEWIISAFIKTILPLFGMMVLHETYASKAKLEKLRNKEKESALGMVITSVVSVMVIWFAVGVFPVYPKVILTGSMKPEIMPGDMVLVEFIDYEEVKIGDPILYSYGEIDILHRVIAISEDGNLFQTQGDNNASPDPDWVTPEQIKAIQVGKVPFVGKPLVWLRSQ
ncbi:signal peptidase I [Acidaminobacter sp. JC074]|uniref:signal peptidase I n=1 Tax=Acidaminobacter sp. JC074 TaxID=2530199 RepID=UPI001F0EBB2F|nr:signal peptidase I [Acidaminobacter sp. JC074]MCH4890622.1 signal peptidase I [Acidaminobacter sp. JC074]